MISIFSMIVQITWRYSHWRIIVSLCKVFRTNNNKMDEEKFEMMMYYFLFHRRKPKINCPKKRRFWVRSIFQKRKRLGE